MPKLDLQTIPETNATSYPSPFREAMATRWHRRLGPAGGLSDFGVSYVRLEPGGISAQRHWHEGEDELVVMIEGEAVLIEDEGEVDMRAGEVAVFPKGVANGHQLVNRSERDCLFVAVGRVPSSDCHYPDVDLHLDAATMRFRRKDGGGY